MTRPDPIPDPDRIFDAAVEHLCRLIGFDTVSRNPNRPLIDHIAGILAPLGARIALLPAPGGKANLIASFGPEDRAGLVWSAHTDVVPADEPGWLADPFVARVTGDRVIGRGACDMKGFAACMLALAPVLARANLARPVHLCFSHDEEVGCLGAPAIARHLAALPAPPELALIGEPSMMRLVTGQKGKIAMRAKVTGIAGHSSLAPGHVNAIEHAARAISLIEARARDLAADGPGDADFTVPHATMLVTTIGGGTATNITPGECSFTFELRAVPGMDPEAEMAALTDRIAAEIGAAMTAPGTGIAFERIFAYPAMGEARDTPGFARLAGLWPDWGGKVSYGSEGGVFEQMGGIPSVILGPGSIEQAHAPEEFVALDQIRACTDFLAATVARLSA